MNCRKMLPHVVLAMILLAVSMIVAAPTGKISGVVVDSSTGDPVVGALITVAGSGRTATTDSNGEFFIPGLPPAKFRLIVTVAGYKTATMEGVVITADSTTEIKIALENSAGEYDKSVVGKVDRFNQTGLSSIMRKEKSVGEEQKSDATSTRRDVLSPEVERSKDERRQIDGVTSSPYGNNAPSTGTDFQKIMIVPQVQPQQPYPSSHGGRAIVNGQPFDAMFFKNYGVNPFVDTEDDHLSTFAIDVDDASFIMARSYLDRGELPPDDAIRVEEFINHFHYNYAQPRRYPFAVQLEGAPSRFGENSHLLRVGIQGKEIDSELRRPANLVFVVDVSGSMAREGRLELVKQSLAYLVDQLMPYDRVGIVTFQTSARMVMPLLSVKHRYEIIDAIQNLTPGGSTNVGEGLRIGYRMADEAFDDGRINRVILCSDGVANVGTTGVDQLLAQTKRFADKGITLMSVGVGMGNLNDVLLEQLGDKGNGHYAYVDDLAEARRVFVENLTANLQVIARDVKIQVDFNPQVVRSYRLLGYENRDVADHKFRDDRQDGGEIGAGHQVTALYEVKFHGGKPHGKIGTIFVRYKNPITLAVNEVSRSIERADFQRSFESASTDFRLAAVAGEFAEILRKSYWARGSSLHVVNRLARQLHAETDNPDLAEMIRMIEVASRFGYDLADEE